MAPNPRPKGTKSTKSPIDLWAGFLDHEKLGPDRTGVNVMVLVKLCEELAKDHSEPYFYRDYKSRLQHRRWLVNKAMDLGIDLPAIKHKGRVAMGRGLLDIWNEQYQIRYGSNVGTVSRHEVVRRTVVTKLANERRQEMVAARLKPEINNQTVFIKQWLIATTKVPGNAQFIDLIKQVFKDMGCEVLAMKGVEGPGCYNLAIKATGSDESALETVAREICMAMQPGKYCDNNETINGFNVLYVADVDGIKLMRDSGWLIDVCKPIVSAMLTRQTREFVAEVCNRNLNWVDNMVKG